MRKTSCMPIGTVFALLIMKLSADGFPNFEFLADNARLLTPVQIIAPDYWGSKENHDLVLLVRVIKGAVQSVAEINGQVKAPAQLKESLKSWRFDQCASGQFLLLCKTGQKLPQTILQYDALDNNPIFVIKALPRYPGSLRAVVSWKVAIEVIIDENGVPAATTILSSTNSDCNNNAHLAALLYRFEIGKKDNKAVAYKTKIEICFDVGG